MSIIQNDQNSIKGDNNIVIEDIIEDFRLMW